jgi:hypothetical protein
MKCFSVVFKSISSLAVGFFLASPVASAPVFSGTKATQHNVADDGSGMTDIDIHALGSSDWAAWQNAIGAPTQQKAGAGYIGDLTVVGTPGGPTSWEFAQFIWSSGGTPSASSASPGFAAGFSSSAGGSGLDAGEGYSIAITLPDVSGTITFWGVSRNAINNLSITNGTGTLYSDSFDHQISEWDVTTFSITWTNATPGEVVTLNWLWSGTGTSSRIGVSGIAVSRHPRFTGSQSTQQNVADDGSSMTGINIANLGTSDWACWQNAVGTPTQQKDGEDFIKNLVEVGSPGGPMSWEFTSFVWPSGGTPLSATNAPGFPSGAVSQNSVSADEGHSVDIELPGETGTITLWGVSRDATDNLFVKYNDVIICTDTYTAPAGQWDVTTFTLNWADARRGDAVTAEYLYSGTGGAPRVGLFGVAVSTPRPFSHGLLFMIH